MLEPIGIDAADEALYRTLVARSQATAEELADALGRSPAPADPGEAADRRSAIGDRQLAIAAITTATRRKFRGIRALLTHLWVVERG